MRNNHDAFQTAPTLGQTINPDLTTDAYLPWCRFISDSNDACYAISSIERYGTQPFSSRCTHNRCLLTVVQVPSPLRRRCRVPAAWHLSRPGRSTWPTPRCHEGRVASVAAAALAARSTCRTRTRQVLLAWKSDTMGTASAGGGLGGALSSAGSGPADEERPAPGMTDKDAAPLPPTPVAAVA